MIDDYTEIIDTLDKCRDFENAQKLRVLIDNLFKKYEKILSLYNRDNDMLIRERNEARQLAVTWRACAYGSGVPRIGAEITSDTLFPWEPKFYLWRKGSSITKYDDYIITKMGGNKYREVKENG